MSDDLDQIADLLANYDGGLEHKNRIADALRQQREQGRERYFLTTDNDSHWYVVPVLKRAEWEAWTEIDSDDERAWTPPTWAKEVGGSPTQIAFTNWSKDDV